MKTWHQLFVRFGWKVERIGEQVFGCEQESDENRDFLVTCLEKAGVSYSFQNHVLTLYSEPVPEENWIKALFVKNVKCCKRVPSPVVQVEPTLQELDIYMRGIVRHLHRLGFYILESCSGHENKGPHIRVQKGRDRDPLIHILLLIGRMKRVYIEDEKEISYQIYLNNMKPNHLLDFAEKMSFIEESWLDQGIKFLREQIFYHLLEELLSIPGESGQEDKVRDVVQEKLAPFVDFMKVDPYGNLLAEKTYGNGHGPTLLLNAHLDTIYRIDPNRYLIKEDGIWSSSTGILSADDRAGVAVLLQTAENLMNSSFKGRVKYIFTVGEECGLVGAHQVEDCFLWSTDAAIVVDRRGKGDIVVSWGNDTYLCEEAYGEFFENVAQAEGLTSWKCTQGGSSDTRIWASHGIQSVNLSVGYENQHWENEYLDIAACYNVTKLLAGVFKKGEELSEVIRRIKSRKNFGIIGRCAK